MFSGTLSYMGDCDLNGTTHLLPQPPPTTSKKSRKREGRDQGNPIQEGQTFTDDSQAGEGSEEKRVEEREGVGSVAMTAEEMRAKEREVIGRRAKAALRRYERWGIVKALVGPVLPTVCLLLCAVAPQTLKYRP